MTDVQLRQNCAFEINNNFGGKEDLMNALTLLKRDHRNVESLFEQYRSASTGKSEILQQIIQELSMHMDAEERELYPVLRTSISDGDDLMKEAVKEHEEAKGLLADLETADSGSFDMDAKVETLRRAIDHHVKEEEGEIFPKAEASLGENRLEDLGTRIDDAKRSAPKQPPISAAANSPGPSIGGTISAATDRVKKLFSPTERREPKRAARKARPRKAI
jgi:hemerythrin superfamily protein